MARDFEEHGQDGPYNAHYDRPAVLRAAIGAVAGLCVPHAGRGPGLYAEELSGALPGFAETVLVGFLFSSRGLFSDPIVWHGASSYSAGGTPPSEVWRRSVLNQATYSTIASSSWERVRQTRSRISSVLKLSTKLSASALS